MPSPDALLWPPCRRPLPLAHCHFAAPTPQIPVCPGAPMMATAAPRLSPTKMGILGSETPVNRHPMPATAWGGTPPGRPAWTGQRPPPDTDGGLADFYAGQATTIPPCPAA